MAIPAASVWEVRPTVGSDTNGGGFVTGSSGTDYSQQNSKNTVGSDISTTDGVGIGTTTFTSATANFSTAIPGNIIYINGGWYEVVSRTNATTVILDRSPGTGTGWTLNIGGALATVSQAFTNSIASNIVYVKASGNYTVTAALQIALQSYPAPGNPYSIIGYTSTRGDNGQFTWTTATNSVDLLQLSPSSTAAINVLFQNISFTTTAGVKATCIKSSGSSTDSVNVTVLNCTINGFTIGIDGNVAVIGAFLGLQVINSRITGCSSHGIQNGASTYILGSLIDNNTGDGFNGTTAPFPVNNCCYFFEKSIFYKNGANGINFPNSNTPSGTIFQYVIVSHCDASTNTGAGMLLLNSTCPYLQVSNSIFDANGTYGIDQNSGTITVSALLYNNAFYNNGTAPTRNVAAGIGTVTLSANPYTTIGTDFSLNSTAGGGAACKGAGWPGVLNAGGTGHADIGALQSSGAVTTTVNVIAPTQIRILGLEGE